VFCYFVFVRCFYFILFDGFKCVLFLIVLSVCVCVLFGLKLVYSL